MTNKELQEILSQYPDDSIVMYRHNQCGRIDIDAVVCKEEYMISENVISTITLEGSFDEGE